MSVTMGLEAVLDRLTRLESEIQVAAGRAADEIALLLTEEARRRHPWRSRSGALEASTEAFAALQGEVFRITLASGVDYARFLELARGGRWAWLWEAVSANEDRIFQILRVHLGGLML